MKILQQFIAFIKQLYIFNRTKHSVVDIKPRSCSDTFTWVLFNPENTAPEINHVDVRDCFTMPELLGQLYPTDDSAPLDKLIFITVSGKVKVFRFEGTTAEDYLEFIASLSEPLEIVYDFPSEHPQTSHWVYRRISDCHYLPSIHFKNTVVV